MLRSSTYSQMLSLVLGVSFMHALHLFLAPLPKLDTYFEESEKKIVLSLLVY